MVRIVEIEASPHIAIRIIPGQGVVVRIIERDALPRIVIRKIACQGVVVRTIEIDAIPCIVIRIIPGQRVVVRAKESDADIVFRGSIVLYRDVLAVPHIDPVGVIIGSNV